MKASYSWLKSYLNIDLPTEKVGEMLTEIGLEVEGIEEYESIKGGLKGLVIGHVLEREQHESADKLSVTKVDVGTGELLQIVCGAPNVAAGQKVVVATIGTTLYTETGESFVIKKSKIRGVESQGMICAEDEIGLGQSHEGIMVLDQNALVGTPAATYFNLETDYVFEIGLTPNRSDATAHIGVAEDLAAYLAINAGYKDGVKKPQSPDFQLVTEPLPLKITIENEAACPRYAGICVRNLTVAPSPEWLKNRLEAIGVRSINNVVDVTNYVLHEFGQPLHAFDYDKIKGQHVRVKTLPQDTKFLCLDEVERALSSEDLMICNGESEGMCIAGVFGGSVSGVSATTTAVFLESAYFDPTTIRRTSMRHNLRTDAAKVFEKGANPDVTVEALKRAVALLQTLAGGEVASELFDHYPTPIQANEIAFTYAKVNQVIGKTLTVGEIDAILAALNIEFVEKTALGGTVRIPKNKFEVTREADLIEEILRIYGFNKVDFPSTINSSIVFSEQPNPYQTRNKIADFLASNGLNEMMNMSIVKTAYQDFLPLAAENLIFIHNTANQNMDLMRPNMVFSGLETIGRNQNRQQPNLRLFEFGKSYAQAGETVTETEHLTLFLTGQKLEESWLNTEKAAVSYFTLKGLVQNVLRRLGINSYQTSALQDEIFGFALKYHRGTQELVTFGEVNPALTKKFGLKHPVLYADFKWANVMKALKNSKIIFEELSKYQAVRRDLALVIDKNVNFENILTIAYKNAKNTLQEVNLFDVYENEEKIGAGKKSYAVSFLFQTAEKALSEKEVEKTMDKLIKTYEQQLQAVVRR